MLFVAMLSAAAALGGSPPQAEPDYLGAQERAVEVARLATSAQSCKHFGLDVDVEAILALPSRIRVLAARDGITLSVADQMLLSALTEERDRLRFMDEQVIGNETDTAEAITQRAVENLEYWRERCSALADGAGTGQFIKHTTPEAESVAYATALEQTSGHRE